MTTALNEHDKTTRRPVAVLGAGAIGASWAALFLAHGRRVAIFDPALEASEPGKGGRAFVEAFVENAAGALTALGAPVAPDPARLSFFARADEAVADAEFVQENAPERLEAKLALYREIEPALAADAVVASSTSGLRLSALAAGFHDPNRLIIAHPFNPPHLIPLVELYAAGEDAELRLARAEAFYASLGKATIRLTGEAPGHVANRLQAALWREAIHLVKSGVASLEDVDKAVWAGPGLRWAIMGPSQLFTLAGGGGGMRGFCGHIGPAMETWWDDLGAPRLDAETVDQLCEGVAAAERGRSFEEIAAERDRRLVALMQALKASPRDDPAA